MTEQQALAFGQLPSLELVAACAGRSRSLVVRIGERLYLLSPAGLLTRFRG